MNQADKLATAHDGSSVVTLRDELEQLKADVQELSLLGSKTNEALTVGAGCR